MYSNSNSLTWFGFDVVGKYHLLVLSFAVKLSSKMVSFAKVTVFTE